MKNRQMLQPAQRKMLNSLGVFDWRMMDTEAIRHGKCGISQAVHLGSFKDLVLK